MITKKNSKFLTSCVMLSVLQVLSISSAHAGNGFFSLFGSHKKQEQTEPINQPIVQEAPVVKKQVATKKAIIQTPRIFTYKPDKLIKVDFTKVNFVNALLSKDNNFINNIILPYIPIIDIENNNQEIDILNKTTPELLSEKFSQINVVAEKRIAETLVDFYTQKGRLVWSNSLNINDKAKQIISLMKMAADEGLNVDEYLVEVPDDSLVGEERVQALYNFDVELSARVLRYIQDVGEGRIVANKLSEFHDLPHNKIDLLDILEKLDKSTNPKEIITSYRPNSFWYNQLKTALNKFKNIDVENAVIIKPDTIIRPGQKNEEFAKVLQLIQKQAPDEYNLQYKNLFQKYAQATLYEVELINAIKEYQKLKNIKPDGIIGPATISALQENSQFIKYQRIKYALERLRWLPHDFGSRYVFINQPSYKAEYYNKGQLVLDMKVVIGSKNNQTTFFYDNIKMVQFTPSWGVPRSIVLNEMMPRIMNDPSYLSRNGYKVYNEKGKQVASNQVDWQKVSSSGYGVNIRQQPGRNNALGELKILFPNKHDIYLHDTPNQTAFQKDMRAISHGCVRLENPRAMAAAVLNESVEQLTPYFKRSENTVHLKENVPIYLTYFTAWPSIQNGEIQYYDDIYNRDQLMNMADEKIHNSRVNKNL